MNFVVFSVLLAILALSAPLISSFYVGAGVKIHPCYCNILIRSKSRYILQMKSDKEKKKKKDKVSITLLYMISPAA